MYNKKIFWIVILVLFAVFAMQFYNYRMIDSVAAVKRINYSFTVQEEMGIDAQTDHLRLGGVAPGGSVWRDVQIESGSGYYKVLVEGSGSEYLVINTTGPLYKGNNNISVWVKPPVSAEYGNYSGTLIFLIYE